MSVRVTWLGHSSVVLDLGSGRAGVPGVRLVTDPLLHRHAGMLRRRGERPAAVWQGSDAVLLSHLHHDHAELRSLRLLGDAPVLTAPANARWLRARGLRGVGLDDAWHAVGPAAAGVEVRLVTAVHGHRPMPHRPNAANGHLVRSDGPRGVRVWVVGDTEHYPDMVHLPALAGGPVDVALVPVGGWGPRLSGGHLGPAQAARVCAEVGVGVAIPVHWGTLHAPGGRHLPRGWMDHAGAAFEAAAQREAPGTRVVVLRPGEAWSSSGDARDA
ncbi:MBL fold metallo-hydrolase [Cellulosimicrobium sp. 22601]|uniref:MBL fold metallo-hydrolase n=1 Tax=unclassified Cellulosimicrobium TaxID=2624466 RepID=UPI003F83DDC2